VQREDFSSYSHPCSGQPVLYPAVRSAACNEFLPSSRTGRTRIWPKRWDLPAVGLLTRRYEAMTEYNPNAWPAWRASWRDCAEIYENAASRRSLRATIEAPSRLVNPVVPRDPMIPLVSAKREVELIGPASDKIAMAVKSDAG